MLLYNHNEREKPNKGGENRMTIARVKQAASIRDIYFNGRKEWINNVVGFGYSAYTPHGFIQADTLNGFYKMVMRCPKIKNN